jgi:hypothetical protein
VNKRGGGGGDRDASDPHDGAQPSLAPGKRSRLAGATRRAAPTGPGKRTLTERLTVDTPGQDADGASGELPFLSMIQRAFGRHDLRGVTVTVGGEASDEFAAMGARAYTYGNHISFAATPDLHTAAHEAAHVIQQRHGITDLPDGAGRLGDRHEQHADAVADAVVAGRSAEVLLDERAIGNAGATPVVQRKEESVNARDYVQFQLPNIHDELRVAITRTGMVAHGPYGTELFSPQFEQALFEIVRRGSSIGYIADGLQRFVAPEPINAMVDRSRGHDWDFSDEDHPVQKSTGPASTTYASPVAVEITNALARRYIQSVTRLFPQFLTGYMELQAMNERLGGSPADVAFPEHWGNLVPTHPMDTAVIHALHAAQKLIPLAQLANKRPDQQAELRAKYAAPGEHGLDPPLDRPTTIQFKASEGLFHWFEAVPAGDPVIAGQRTAAEVAKALFRTGMVEQASEEAYRLISVPPLWGFRASDIEVFRPEHVQHLRTQWAVTSRSTPWPADIGNAIGMQVNVFDRPKDEDPIAELSSRGEQRAIDRAAAIDPPGQGDKDEASVASRLTEDLRVIDTIARVLELVHADLGALATARDRLFGRYDEATSTVSCMVNPAASFALADQQGDVLAEIASGLNEVAVKHQTYGGDEMDPGTRALLDDCIAPFVEAIGALEFPEIATPRAALGAQRVLAFDISVQESSLHSGMPVVDEQLHSDQPTKEFDANQARTQTNELAYDLGAVRMTLASDPAHARTELGEKAPKIGDLEFDIGLSEKLLRLDQFWQAIDGEDDFWESPLEQAIGDDLKKRSRALRTQFVEQVKQPYDEAKKHDDEAGKLKARESFKLLLAQFKPFAEEVRHFIKTVEKHKKWSKIIVGIAIAIVAFALGQFEFAAILAAEGTIVEAAVIGGVVTTTTSMVLEKLILNHDPSLGGIITGFVGNIAMFGVIGRMAMTAKAAGLGAEVADATVGAAQAVHEGGEAAAAAGGAADAATIGSKVAKRAIALTTEVVLGDALILVQSEVANLIDNHELLTTPELVETAAMGVVNVLGMKVGQYGFDSALDSFKGYRAAKGIDLDGLFAEREELHQAGLALNKAAGGPDKLARGPAPRDQAQALLDRWQSYFKREREVGEQLTKLAEEHPRAFKAKAGELARLHEEGVASAALDRQFQQAKTILGLKEIGPNLYRADPAVIDNLLAQHAAAGSELVNVTTDPHTGQRTLSFRTADGLPIEIVEKLPDVGKRTAPKVSVGSARFFEEWLGGLDTTTPEGAQIRRDLVAHYARDPAAAMHVAAEHYGFAPGELPETELIVKPDAHVGAVRGSEVYPANTYTTKDGAVGVSKLNAEKIKKALKPAAKNKYAAEASAVVDLASVTDTGARMTLRVPEGTGHAEVHVTIHVKPETELAVSDAHGADAGPARLTLVRETTGEWKANIEISQGMRPEDLEFAITHELDEAAELVRRYPKGEPVAGFKPEMQAGVMTPGATTGKSTAHDVAAAREIVKLFEAWEALRKSKSANPQNVAHRRAVLDRAMEVQGLNDPTQVPAKLALLHEAGAPLELIRQVEHVEARRVFQEHSDSLGHPSQLNESVIHHLLYGENQGGNTVGGGHHTEELLRFVEADVSLALLQIAERRAGGAMYRRYEQYQWIHKSVAKPKPKSGRYPGELGFNKNDWTLSNEPKTTFDDPAAFLREAEAAWSDWLNAATTNPPVLGTNARVGMTSPSGIVFQGYLVSRHAPFQLSTLYPEAAWF